MDNKRELRMEVRSIVTEIAQTEAERLGTHVGSGFVNSLADLVFKQMETFGLDVESFASHGRRAAINMDDVLLCSRRNDRLHHLLSGMSDDLSKPLDRHFKQTR